MNTFIKISASIAVLTFAITTSSADASQSANPATSNGPKAHWSYSGSEGPSKWGDLSTAYQMCKTGHQQSPINITAPQNAGLAKIKTDYHAVPLNIQNNGHTIQVNYQPGSTLTVGLSKYKLLQFHFHTPSENKLNGESFPMEVHFVHKDLDGRLGVLGVFFKTGDKNLALQEIWSHMPSSASEAINISDVVINGFDLIPRNLDYVRFTGSLTTPPCSEGVQWHVMKTPIEASPKQIQAFTDIIGKNARPVQALGMRLLIDSSHSGGGASSSH